ncbi:hypothetical protein [Anaerotignum faecicola]
MEYCIRYIDMPSVTKGMTIEDSDGFFNIYINASLSAAEQEEAIRHEIRHLDRKDFDTEKSLLEAETL